MVLCVAAVTTIIFQKIRQPVVVGYLIAGLIVGPNVPIPLLADPERIHTLSELGVILLMFALGLEFSVRKLIRLGPTSGFICALQVGFMIWLGYMCGRAMGWTPLESIFTGAILSISSTTIVAKAYHETPVSERLRELVFGVLLAEDLTAVVELAILTTLASGASVSASLMTVTIARLILFLVAFVGIGFIVVPPVVRFVVRMGRPETTLVATVGLCFAFAILAEHAGYSVALGAFLAGSLVAESGEAEQIEHLVAAAARHIRRRVLRLGRHDDRSQAHRGALAGAGRADGGRGRRKNFRRDIRLDVERRRHHKPRSKPA